MDMLKEESVATVSDVSEGADIPTIHMYCQVFIEVCFSYF